VLAVLLQQGHGPAGRDAGYHERRRVAAAGVRPGHVGSGSGPCGSGYQDRRHEQEYTGPRALARLSRTGLPVS
jgi:hypothetical protein